MWILLLIFRLQAVCETEHNGSGETGDTGFGDSHPDASLLFKNQKVFYENLIVSTS